MKPDPAIYFWYEPRQVINFAIPRLSHVGHDDYHLKNNEIMTYGRIKSEINIQRDVYFVVENYRV